MIRVLGVLLMLSFIFAANPLVAQLPPHVNTFELNGTVTEVDNDNDFFVVTVDGQDVVVVCDVDVRPGCAELEEFRFVFVKGHFGLVGEACSGREIYYNPLIVDDLWQCVVAVSIGGVTGGMVCEQL